MRFWIWFVFGVWIAAISNPARAEYPERLITLIVAVPPGGAGDLVARQFAEHATGDGRADLVATEDEGARVAWVVQGVQHVAAQ